MHSIYGYFKHRLWPVPLAGSSSHLQSIYKNATLRWRIKSGLGLLHSQQPLTVDIDADGGNGAYGAYDVPGHAYVMALVEDLGQLAATLAGELNQFMKGLPLRNGGHILL